ncbi:hypothetical protein PHYBOEH_009258 [Phytophthora boehmeriae]|uniref:G domain-containing protein n=1 Tax=Phytophthora boehmeriae TaxID=109152 RepID=A0A8T1VZ37_9STRA|nr:hypothetical protein PHYBOEH_009258 [Phytophthora boehmeriae]
MSNNLRENRLFLGNPGTGKSTLINCLIGNQVFQAGVNWGDGLTRDFQRFESNGVTYMDTPGLADGSIIELAARAITTALKQSGSYKLFFMVRLQNGRVVSEDLSTVESVLDSIELPGVRYSILINNISRKVYETLSTRGREFDAIASLINSGKYSTTNICLIPRIDELTEKNNQVVQLPLRVVDFIENKAPTISILQTNVKNIAVDKFHQQTAKIRAELEEARRENLELIRRVEELEKQRHVSINVDEVPAYPTAVPAVPAQQPQAPYTAHPATPVARNKIDPDEWMPIFCCCFWFGPLGVFCYFFFFRDR